MNCIILCLLLLFSLVTLPALAQQSEQTFVVKKPVKKQPAPKKTCVLLINGKEYFNDVVIDRADLKGLCTLTVLNKQTGETVTPSSFKWFLKDPNAWYLGSVSDCQKAYTLSSSAPGSTIDIFGLQYNTDGGCFVKMTLLIN